MIYPNDVYAKTKRGTNMSEAEKAKIAMGVVFVVLAGIIAMSAGFWTELGVSLVFVGIAGVILWLFICLQIYRFAIFREQDRDLEESDMFLPYYKIRPGSAKIKNPVQEFDMFELKNNSYLSTILLRMGRNNEQKAQYTAEFFNQVQDIVHEKGLRLSIVVMKEDFMASEEATRMLRNINDVSEPQLRASLLAVYNEVFSFAEEKGSALCYYLMVYAPRSALKDELEDAIVQILTQYRKSKHLHAVRSLEFLEQKSLLAFFKRFYGLGAIDLSLSRVQYNTTDSDVLKSISVYRIIAKTGTSFGNPMLDKISTNVKFIKK